MMNFINKLVTKRNMAIAGLTALGFLVFLIALNYGLEKYNQSKQWQEIKKSAEAFQKAEQELYQKMMADTYGGKTPEETLDMYIEAVEKGDYELASRYFVVEKQEEWKKELFEIEKVNKKNVFLEPLRQSKNSEGEYSESQQTFAIYKPVAINFILYPNGIWKISEI